jgi:arabinofuranosyltransferase
MARADGAWYHAPVPRLSKRETIGLAAILALAAVGLYAGWRLFWYLTDDAYITFRYASNSWLGYGYVWNAPPFRPVEGYTSFLWLVMLDGVWRLTGVEPPESANWLSLAFAGGTLLVTAGMVLRLRLRPALARFRLAFLTLVLFGTLTNRTFLAWTSSGLETAMHNFWLAAWVLVALSFAPGGGRWLTALAALAVMLELTRPDGLLFLAVTLGLVAAGLWQRWRARTLSARDLAPLAPFVVTAAHVLWRLRTYGEWLPNTYAAKYVSPWPASGWRYLLSFVIEYSLWLWLVLVPLALLVMAFRAGSLAARLRQWAANPVQPVVVQAAVVGALAAHWAYYTFIIGGDHFEYRVYSHLVPLLLVALVWALNALAVRPALALGAASLSIAAGLPIPWILWAASLRYTTRLETLNLRVPVAPYFPFVLQPYVAVFDRAQDWLIEHAVGVRHQEHKVFAEYQLSLLPSRQAGLLLSPEAQAVRIEGAVGAVGWALPTLSIIDSHGLNDRVVARHPLDANAPRLMAHDRYAPEGYLGCFEPNADTPLRKFIVGQRPERLESLVPDCENRVWPVTPWRAEWPGYNLALAPAAARVIYDVWTVDPLFFYYVPPGQPPIQSPAALLSAFEQQYHDVGCLVFPPAGSADEYQYAFLPANLRYAPDELHDLFPWTLLADYKRVAAPVPYSLAYAVPAAASEPAPATAHSVAWPAASLVGFSLPSSELEPGGLLEVMLQFRILQAAATEQWFRLSLAPATQPNAPMALDQADPCRGMYPAPLWLPGQLILAKAQIQVPPDLPAGDYGLRVDMFDLAVGPDQPLPAAGEPALATLSLR